MHEDLKKRYDYGSWGKRRPEAVPVLLQGFKPWRKDCLDWSREGRLQLRETAQWQLRRSMWVPSEDPDQRVLIEVRETDSAAASRECLLDVLAQNELARLPEGPEDIGDVCFVHPDGHTPAIFWTAGNLCVSVLSIGLAPVPVLDWARRLHDRTTNKPKANTFEVSMKPAKGRLSVEEEKAVEIAWPTTLSDEGFYQFFSEQADLRLKNGELRIYAPNEGPVAVEAFIVEPDRPPLAGRLELSAKKIPR